jgi:cytosine/adenosine deaminase-related metal-dependent hydrolase
MAAAADGSRTTSKAMEVLGAGWVVPVTSPPLRDGRVAVSKGRVVWVGRRGDPGEPAAAVRDLGLGVLLPGLVNAHCHLEASHLEGRLPLGQGFVPWVGALVGARGSVPEETVRGAAAAAIGFLERRGTVAVGDVSNRLDHLDCLSASSLRSVVFFELLGWDPLGADATMAWAAERLAAAAVSSSVAVRLAAHGPHSVSPALLSRLVSCGGPAAMHLAESPEEVRFLATGDGAWKSFLAGRGLGHVAFSPPGVSPVRYVDGLGALHPRLVAAHGVQVDDADRAILARRGVHVALCPRSNRNLCVGTADVPALLEAGVPLCLGTDSLASVATLDVLEDAVLLHHEFPQIDPAHILRMATLGGAQALGLADLGTIEPGKAAAFAFAPAPAPPADPHRFLLSGEVQLAPVERR